MGAAAGAGRGGPACFLPGMRLGAPRAGTRRRGQPARSLERSTQCVKPSELARAGPSCVASACLQKQPLSVPRASPAFVWACVASESPRAQDVFGRRALASVLQAASLLPNPSQRLPGRLRARLHANCSAWSIALGHQSSCTAIHHRSTASNASPAPPPRRPPDHVLRHRNINVRSSAGLLPARTESNRTTQTNSNREAPAPTTSKSSRTSTARSRQSAKTLLLPASSSHTAAALTKRGWRQTKNPKRRELLWYQAIEDWGHVQKWQLVNHVKRERDIGHKRNLARRLQGTAGGAVGARNL